MLDWVFRLVGELLVEVIFYHIGRWTLLLLTGGRYDTSKRGTNEGLVELLGVLMCICLVFVPILFVGTWA